MTKVDRVNAALAECRRAIDMLDRRDNGIGSVRRSVVTIQHELRELLSVLLDEEATS